MPVNKSQGILIALVVPMDKNLLKSYLNCEEMILSTSLDNMNIFHFSFASFELIFFTPAALKAVLLDNICVCAHYGDHAALHGELFRL